MGLARADKQIRFLLLQHRKWLNANHGYHAARLCSAQFDHILPMTYLWCYSKKKTTDLSIGHQQKIYFLKELLQDPFHDFSFSKFFNYVIFDLSAYNIKKLK